MSVTTLSSTARTFMLPDLGEGLSEAEVIEWAVAPGDEVHVDQIVVTVETAKATVDLPCPYAGPVLTLHAEPGTVLEVGKALVTIGAAQNPNAEQRSGSGNVLVGYGTSEAQRSGRRRVNAPTRPAAHSTCGSVTAAAHGSLTPAPRPAPKVISPVVRKLARDNKIDLAAVIPSGPGDVIRRADIEATLRIGRPGSPSQDSTPARGRIRADRFGDLRIPLRGVRRTIADKMTRSRREIPEATTWVDVDATALMASNDQIKATIPATGIGLLALFARISIAGLTKFPELNAWVDVEAQEIVQLGDINLSFAAQSPRGLVVPVVHAAGQMTTAELAAGLRELTGLARDCQLSARQMTGGTFTLNNYGVFGTDGATPIINYPQAAMLGVGRIIDRPWAHEGQVALRKVVQLGLTFDHRVCDGATAGGFLRFVADCVEKPALLLAEL
jgi:pyruvate dehydrogenase E2 component (dihydrolipoamide acetyltransferase)